MWGRLWAGKEALPSLNLKSSNVTQSGPKKASVRAMNRHKAAFPSGKLTKRGGGTAPTTKTVEDVQKVGGNLSGSGGAKKTKKVGGRGQKKR